MEYREEERLHDQVGFIVPAASVAWQLFAQTGMPGLYMLYSDIEHGEERSPLD